MNLETAELSARFTEIRSLGEGATGRVLEVFDNTHGARFALKQLRTDRTFDAEQITRFKDEFRTLERIAHPNVAKVYELVSDATGLFVLMELVEGVDFIEHVRPSGGARPTLAATASDAHAPAPPPRGGTLSVATLRDAFGQLASAVTALHAARKVHCDLKPENVLVTREGRVVVLDFGLLSDPSYASPGSAPKARGTPAFMAPEQTEGVVTTAVDWYACGVILYVALTGRMPFGGTSQTLAYTKRFTPPIDPRLVASGVPDDLAELALRSLDPDPDARPGGEQVLRALTAPSTKGPVLVHTGDRFTGRELELVELQLAYEKLSDGETVVAHVHGESGIGKSALIRRFIEKVEARPTTPTVIRGACYPDASIPYRGLDAVIDRVASAVAAGKASLGDDDRKALATLFPIFGAARLRAEVDWALRDAPDLRGRAVRSLRAVLSALAKPSPLIICIDDFQWADDESVDLWTEILRSPRPAGVLVIVAYRSSKGAFGAIAQRARKSLPCDVDVEVRPLGVDDVRSLVGSELRGSEHGRIERIADESGGNPFFVGELLRARAWQASRPSRTLDDALRFRVEELDPVHRECLELVAVAGRPVSGALLAAALCRTNVQTLDARRSLITSCFLRVAESKSDRVETYHDRLREHVLRELAPNELRARHASIAAAYEETGATDAEALAAHHRSAGHIAKAIRYGVIAGDAAARALAFEHAVELYENAIALAGDNVDSTLRTKHADALSCAGRAADAARAYLSVAATTSENVELLLQAGDELLRAGEVDRGLEVLRDVAKTIEMPIPASNGVAQAALLWHGLMLRRARPSSERALRPRELHQLRLCLTIAKQLAMVDTVRGALFQRRYLRLALETGSRLDVGQGFAIEASFSAHMPTYVAGGIERAKTLLATANGLIGEDAPPYARGLLPFGEAMIHFAEGRWRASRLAFERTVEIYRERTALGLRSDVLLCLGFIAFMLWMEGDVEEIRARIHGYRREAKGNLSMETIIALRVGTMLSLCDDDVASARRTADEVLGRWPTKPERLQHYFGALAQAEIDLYEGNAKQAQARVADAWKMARDTGIHQVAFFEQFATVLRARASISAGALSAAERDIAKLEGQGARWAAALGRSLRACLLTAHGRHAEAARALGAAANELEACDLGLYALAARCRAGERAGSASDAHAAVKDLRARTVRAPHRLIASLLPIASL